MIIVFFDGKCNLCSKEINYYRKIAPKDVFDWQDININGNDFIKTGIKTSDGLKILHVLDNNVLYVGVDAFIIIWNNLSYWKILGMLVSLPLIKQMVGLAYRVFANWRFSRLEHCIIAKKNDDKL